MGLRDELAAYLATELDDVNVFAAGVEITSSPAVVINPTDPYMVPATFGKGPDSQIVVVGLELWLVVGRAGPEAVRLTELEALRKRVTDALMWGAFPVPAVWQEFGQFGTMDIGGQLHATGRLEMTFRDRDR